MSELPERKVLKDMLVKLKTKAIESQQNASAFSTHVSGFAMDSLRIVGETAEKTKDENVRSTLLAVANLLNGLTGSVNLWKSLIFSMLSDANLYIETLEKYSTELDSTLTTIFEMAKKDAEEQRKQQEEISNRKPSYRT